MALFKFLLSMPRLRATRDHVSESLWPDIDAERAGKALAAGGSPSALAMILHRSAVSSQVGRFEAGIIATTQSFLWRI